MYIPCNDARQSDLLAKSMPWSSSVGTHRWSGTHAVAAPPSIPAVPRSPFLHVLKMLKHVISVAASCCLRNERKYIILVVVYLNMLIKLTQRWSHRA